LCWALNKAGLLLLGLVWTPINTLFGLSLASVAIHRMTQHQASLLTSLETTTSTAPTPTTPMTLLEEEDPEVEHVSDLDDSHADISSPFHGFPSSPIHAPTPIDNGELLDDPSTPGEDGAIGGRKDTSPPIDPAAASLAEQSKFYSALLDEVEFFTEGVDQTLQAVQALDPESPEARPGAPGSIKLG